MSVTWKVQVASMLLFAASGSNAQNAIGRISEIAGDSTIMRDAFEFRALFNAPLIAGDDVSTGVKSGLTLKLIDDSKYKLGPSTSLSLDEFVFDLPAPLHNHVTLKFYGGSLTSKGGAIATVYIETRCGVVQALSPDLILTDEGKVSTILNFGAPVSIVNNGATEEIPEYSSATFDGACKFVLESAPAPATRLPEDRLNQVRPTDPGGEPADPAPPTAPPTAPPSPPAPTPAVTPSPTLTPTAQPEPTFTPPPPPPPPSPEPPMSPS